MCVCCVHRCSCVQETDAQTTTPTSSTTTTSPWPSSRASCLPHTYLSAWHRAASTTSVWLSRSCWPTFVFSAQRNQQNKRNTNKNKCKLNISVWAHSSTWGSTYKYHVNNFLATSSISTSLLPPSGQKVYLPLSQACFSVIETISQPQFSIVKHFKCFFEIPYCWLSHLCCINGDYWFIVLFIDEAR